MTAKYDVETQRLWEKYEDIAVHFNDLLMRLRSQSLAAIAAISTLVGIFTKTNVPDIHVEWLMATCIFSALALFWTAIGCLDLLYYNRLLMGAVRAILELESKCAAQTFDSISMSSSIDSEFRNGWFGTEFSRFRGVILFYGIVLLALILGVAFSFHFYCTTQTTGTSGALGRYLPVSH